MQMRAGGGGWGWGKEAPGSCREDRPSAASQADLEVPINHSWPWRAIRSAPTNWAGGLVLFFLRRREAGEGIPHSLRLERGTREEFQERDTQNLATLFAKRKLVHLSRPVYISNWYCTGSARLHFVASQSPLGMAALGIEPSSTEDHTARSVDKSYANTHTDPMSNRDRDGSPWSALPRRIYLALNWFGMDVFKAGTICTWRIHSGVQVWAECSRDE